MQFLIDPKSGVPFYRQIIEHVKLGVSRGELGPGDQLPTVRQLAVDLSVNPNTVIRAYRELEFEGFLETQQGTGTFVSTEKHEVDLLEKQRMLDRIVNEALARGAAYGISLEEMSETLLARLTEPTS